MVLHLQLLLWMVNNDSAVDELSSEDVKAIYTGEAITWEDVIK